MLYSILETKFNYTINLPLRLQTKSVSSGNWINNNIKMYKNVSGWLTYKTYCGRRYVI